MRMATIIFLLLLFLPAGNTGYVMAQANQEILNRTVYLPGKKESVYNLLAEVSKQAGYLFIYDSNIIDNDKKVKVKKGPYSVRQAIHTITGNNRLSLKVIGSHILIYPKETSLLPILSPAEEVSRPDSFFTIQGIIKDSYTEQPITFGTVGIRGHATGTITNLNGEFRLRLPDSLNHAIIHFSHLGYEPQEFECSLLENRHSTITLEPRIIPLQEVVVRLVNPAKLLEEMRRRFSQNYSSSPVYQTSFYREGVERKNNLVSLSEAIFRIYKSPYHSTGEKDQVKLLKMRKITNTAERDTVIAKMKSGVEASILLDLVKNIPDFLSAEGEEIYNYLQSDITVIGHRLAHVILFEQKKEYNFPLYKGTLYIDTESAALLQADFELNPRLIRKAKNMLILRQSRNIRITPVKASYKISYKEWDGNYYINHVRGDLHFQVKGKRQLFNSPLHMWFEMATGKIETGQVSRFTRKETLPLHTIFSETNYKYDFNFWKDFNVIPAEESLMEAIGKISSKIEETPQEGL